MIFEELFFRGVLQAWLQRVGPGAADKLLIGGWDSQTNLAVPQLTAEAANPTTTELPSQATFSRTNRSVWPILATSILFALAHLGQGPAPVSLFFFGIALGYIFQRTGSIIPCIVLHMALNAFSMFWFTLRVLAGELESASMADSIYAWITF